MTAAAAARLITSSCSLVCAGHGVHHACGSQTQVPPVTAFTFPIILFLTPPPPWQVLEKERFGGFDVRISLPDPDRLMGRTPVLVDDIISSAHTMVAAARHVTELGHPPPVCLAVHAIFAAESHALLTAAAGRIVTTNTVTHRTNKIDMAADIATAIAGLLRKE